MNAQNKEPPPKRRTFGWFGLREKLRIVKQMYQFHRTLDVEQALRAELWKGMRLGRKHAALTSPYCDLHNDPEFDKPLVSIAPGIFICGLCRTLTSAPMPVARPTIKLVMPPDVERQTGPIIHERPFLAYGRDIHPDAEAGEDTQHVRAIRLKERKTE